MQYLVWGKKERKKRCNILCEEYSCVRSMCSTALCKQIPIASQCDAYCITLLLCDARVWWRASHYSSHSSTALCKNIPIASQCDAYCITLLQHYCNTTATLMQRTEVFATGAIFETWWSWEIDRHAFKHTSSAFKSVMKSITLLFTQEERCLSTPLLHSHDHHVSRYWPTCREMQRHAERCREM